MEGGRLLEGRLYVLVRIWFVCSAPRPVVVVSSLELCPVKS